MQLTVRATSASPLSLKPHRSAIRTFWQYRATCVPYTATFVPFSKKQTQVIYINRLTVREEFKEQSHFPEWQVAVFAINPSMIRCSTIREPGSAKRDRVLPTEVTESCPQIRLGEKSCLP